MLNIESNYNKEKVIKKIKKISANISVMCKKAKTLYMSKSKRDRAVIACVVGVVIGLIIFAVVYISLPSHRISSKSQYMASQVQGSKELSAASQTSQMQKNASQQTLRETSLQSQLKQLQKTVANSSLSQSKINNLEAQIENLTKSVLALQKSSDAAKDAALKAVAQEQAHANLEIYGTHQLQTQLTKLSKAVMPQKYLSASILPFKVVGLDFWNGKPMVSIAMRDVSGVTHYRLIGQGMRYSCGSQSSKMHPCLDWIVREISTSANGTKEVIFVNDKNQHVKVEL